MAKHPHRVAVIGLGIDQDLTVIQQVSHDPPDVAAADATDAEALEQLRVFECSPVVVAIGERIEASLLATSCLSDHGAPAIWAKASTQKHATLLRRMGAHRVVLPEQEAGERLSHLITGAAQDYLEMDRGWAAATIPVHGRLIGAGPDSLRGTLGRATIVSFGRGDTHQPPEAHTTFAAGDTLLVWGPVADVGHFIGD